MLVGLTDGADLARAEADVSALARTAGSPTVETRDEYLDAVGQEINQMLTIVYVLLAVAVVIALLGIANTLTLSIHERTRELGVLRAVGQTRRQLRSMIRWESAVVVHLRGPRRPRPRHVHRVGPGAGRRPSRSTSPASACRWARWW